MSRDEKRSDDGRCGDLIAPGACDCARPAGHDGSHENGRGDVTWTDESKRAMFGKRSDYVLVPGPESAQIQIDALSAALAAAREDAQQHRERANSNFDEALMAMSERDAARVEVTQLQARIDRAMRASEQYRPAAFDGDIPPYIHGAWVAANNIRAALAEPLGSTEDPPAEGRSE